MRITFVLPVANMSGGTKVVSIYAKTLAARGHNVLLVSLPPAELPFKKKVKSFLRGNGWPSKVPAYQSYFDEGGFNHDVLDRWRPVTDDDVPDADVVIATWWETAEWVNALSPGKGAKVYFVQGHEVFPYLPIARCRATYKLPMHKIAVSRWLKDIMRNEYSDSIVDVVPNSVDQTQFFAPSREKQVRPTVGFLYSTSSIKGLDIAYKAIDTVRVQFPDLRIVSFGSQHPTAELPPPDGAEFSFSPPQDEIRELYAQCDVWIVASRNEGFGLPAIEAMACRTPVVSTRIGWPAEAIVQKENGVLVAIDDCDALATGVEWVLSLSNSDWMRLSHRAYGAAAEGSWEKSAEAFERALEHALQRASRGDILGASSSESTADCHN